MNLTPCNHQYDDNGQCVSCPMKRPYIMCKEANLSGLKELSDLTGGEASDVTLINWHKSKPNLFVLLCRCAAVDKKMRAYR